MAPAIGRNDPHQQAAEARLRQADAQRSTFQAAVEATRMPMVVTDATLPSNPIVYANSAFLQMSGYEASEVLGADYLLLTGEATDDSLGQRLGEALKARRSREEEVVLYRKDGAPITVSVFVSPIVDNGRVVRHFASFLDVSRRAVAERGLEDARAALEQRVAERTAQLERAKAQLEAEVERRRRAEVGLQETLRRREEDLRYQSFLTREVNHRTKNALQIASAMLQIQARRTNSDECAAGLAAASQRLTRMAEVHRLLYLEGQAESVDFGPYLRSLVADVAEAHDPRPEGDKIAVEVETLELRLSPDVALPLGLIAGEAVTNVMKHAFPDGRDGRVEVRLEPQEAGQLRLTVEDDGVGIPGRPCNTSMGLELIRLFAAQIGGRSTLGPAPQGGTRVSVEFTVPDPALEQGSL